MAEIPKEEAIDLYLENGWSISELGRSYGITRAAMRKRLLRWGVTLRSQAEQARLDAAGRDEGEKLPDEPV
jgi:transposase-like protein